MGSAIGGILPLAIGVALSPVPIIAIVLVLGTPRARSNGLAFTFGWLIGLTIITTIMLLIGSAGGASSSGEPATWVSVLLLVLGVLLALGAVRIWHRRPAPGQEAQMPKWMQTIGAFTAVKSFGLSAALSALNPKNLLLTVAAATTISAAGLPGGQEAISAAVFVLLGSVTILGPLVIYISMGERAARILDGIKAFMVAHNAAIMTVIFLLLGAKLIGNGIAGLSS